MTNGRSIVYKQGNESHQIIFKLLGGDTTSLDYVQIAKNFNARGVRNGPLSFGRIELLRARHLQMMSIDVVFSRMLRIHRDK